MRRRNFPIHLLNDSLKSLQQRAGVIQEWQREGGVLLMGYELYRQLANKKAKRRKAQRAGSSDVDEDDRNRSLLTGGNPAPLRNTGLYKGWLIQGLGCTAGYGLSPYIIIEPLKCNINTYSSISMGEK